MKVISSLLISLTAVALFAAPAYAVPNPPNAYYGTVTSGGSAVPDGLAVAAKIGGVEYAATTTSGGQYGYEPWLDIPADDLDTPEKEGGVNGDKIEFYVGGVKAAQAGTFEWGARTRLDLTVAGLDDSPAGGDVGGGGGGSGGGGSTTSTTTTTTIATTTAPPPASTSALQVIISGKSISFPIGAGGEVLDDIKVTSGDGAITLTVPQGTIARGSDGQALGKIEVNINTGPPAAPPDARIVGPAYEFGPEGTTFDPAMTIEFNYDANDVPPDTADLALAYYDVSEQQWVEMASQIDTGIRKITASISHFSIYAVLAHVVTVTNTPAPAPATTFVAGLAAQPTPAAGATAMTPAPVATATATGAPTNAVAPFNRPLIGGIFAGVVVITLIILFAIRKGSG